MGISQAILNTVTVLSMLTNQEKVNVVKEMALTSLPLLSEAGYQFEKIETTPENLELGLGESFDVFFRNDTRRINFHVIPRDSPTDAVMVSFYNIVPVENADWEYEPYFSLDDWQKTHNQFISYEKWRIYHYGGKNFNEALGNYFSQLNEVLSQEELTKIIRGETWENIPFDWESVGR